MFPELTVNFSGCVSQPVTSVSRAGSGTAGLSGGPDGSPGAACCDQSV